MNVIATSLPEVLILEPKAFGDERGFFMESFNQKLFDDTVGRPVSFVQDNHSRSARGVLRGLHFQREPRAQGKLVRVAYGAVFDVAVDIRRDSPTFGRWVGETLSDVNRRMMWIPAGFAHGFLVLSDVADFLYKTTDYYAPETEGSIQWNDPSIGIAWPDPGMPLQLSGKDKVAPRLCDVTC